MTEGPERIAVRLTAPEWLMIVDALTFLGVWTENEVTKANEDDEPWLTAMSDEAKRLTLLLRYDDPVLRAFLDEHEEAMSRE